MRHLSLVASPEVLKEQMVEKGRTAAWFDFGDGDARD